jgi:hypothetical protein
MNGGRMQRSGALMQPRFKTIWDSSEFDAEACRRGSRFVKSIPHGVIGFFRDSLAIQRQKISAMWFFAEIVCCNSGARIYTEKGGEI